MIIIPGKSNAPKCDFFPETEFICTSGSLEIHAKNSILIIGEKPPEIILREAFAVIADGDGFQGFVPRGIQLITCGLSGKNTLCVTSRRQDKITVSLNRAINTLNGIVEPLEIPVNIAEGISEFDCMAAMAAKLLLG